MLHMLHLVLLALGSILCSGAGDCEPLHQANYLLSNEATGRAQHGVFPGFSFEAPHGPLYFRQPAFLTLMRQLTEASGGVRGPHIRVGGFTSDTTVYLGRHGRAEWSSLPRVAFRIHDGDVAVLRNVLEFNGSLTVGLNFANPSHPEVAGAHLRALLDVLPPQSLHAVEIGNEVDRYPSEAAHLRKPPYDYDEYIDEFDAFIEHLRGVVGDVAAQKPGEVAWKLRVSGPATTQEGRRFHTRLDDFVKAYGVKSKRLLSNVNVHAYALLGCRGARLGILNLMRAGQLKVAPNLITAARSVGLPAVIGEGNSITCGGRRGVSDTLGAALWAVDAFMQYAVDGVSRFIMHGGPSYPYTPLELDGSAATSASPAPAAMRAGDDEEEHRARVLRKGGDSMMDGPDASFFSVGAKVQLRKRSRAPPAQHSSGGVDISASGAEGEGGEEGPSGGAIRVKAMYYAAYVVTSALAGSAEPTSHMRFCCGRRGGCKHRFVNAYTWRDRTSGDLRHVVVNKLLPTIMEDAEVSHTVQVTPPKEGLRLPNGSFKPVLSAWLFVLAPPPGGNASAVWGLSWGGMSFDGTVDGLPTTPLRPRLLPPSNGEYFYQVQQSTVAMLVLSSRAPKDFPQWQYA